MVTGHPSPSSVVSRRWLRLCRCSLDGALQCLIRVSPVLSRVWTINKWTWTRSSQQFSSPGLVSVTTLVNLDMLNTWLWWGRRWRLIVILMLMMMVWSCGNMVTEFSLLELSGSGETTEWESRAKSRLKWARNNFNNNTTFSLILDSFSKCQLSKWNISKQEL